MSLMLVMGTMRICTATSSVNISSFTKPALPSIFSIINILFYVLVIKFLQIFTNTCSYLEGNKLKNLIPRNHQNAVKSIVYANKTTYFGIPQF